MEERNSSKMILLSIIGIAVLVIAVVGVSFAFFSYSRTGTSNNVIETGQIFMNFTEGGSTISLSNQFPMKNSEATAGLSASGSYMSFSVIGYSSGSSNIPYKVYAIRGADESGKTRFPDSQISVFISSASTDTQGASVSNAIPSPTPINSVAIASSTGWEIASGSIKSGTDLSTKQTDSYTLKMFVNDTVRISDTDPSVTWTGASTAELATNYCASQRTIQNSKYVSGCKLYLSDNTVTVDTTDTSTHTYLPLYSNMFYSLKVKVVGNV